MISSQQAQEIVGRGGGLILDASAFDAGELQEIAKRALIGHGIVILRRSANLAPVVVNEILSRSQGRVIFDFSE